jgi:hypothetical protein
MLGQLIALYGKPQSICCDNGPELTLWHFLAWAIHWKLDPAQIQPGNPTQNGGIQDFHLIWGMITR